MEGSDGRKQASGASLQRLKGVASIRNCGGGGADFGSWKVVSVKEDRRSLVKILEGRIAGILFRCDQQSTCPSFWFRDSWID
jgi:hypothetical protein